MTNQEMFDRAVRGLSSQGWTRCVTDFGNGCVYSDGEGKHCAWGWVDPDLPPQSAFEGNRYPKEWGASYVNNLRDVGVGVAASLTDDQLKFAQALQRAHDNSYSPVTMVAACQEVALRYSLTWPSVLPVSHQ